LDAGLAMGDREMIELAQAGYQYGKDHGETLMGYFPEMLGVKPDAYGNTCEICEVTDMIYLALRQSTNGLADCWDDLDCWLRNMYSEAQLLETDWAYDYAKQCNASRDVTWGTTERVPERWLGAWGGWIAANDWQGNRTSSLAPCCHPNAAIQLYRVWRDMIGYDAERRRLSVHLLLNRASPWADIHSHIPYQGLVEVALKTDCEVAIRRPAWAEPDACSLAIDGARVPPAWEGRYAVASARAGQTVSLRCLLPERSETLHIIDKDYRVIVRGSEIVDIDPPGTRHPIFQKPRYRTGQTQWRTLERFVAERQVTRY
jgi:hypothetical protein